MSIRLDTTGWATWSTGTRAVNLNLLQKAYDKWTKLDNKCRKYHMNSQSKHMINELSWIINVGNITWIHNLHRGNHENQENGIDNRREKLSWGKDTKGYISRNSAITATVHNWHNATKPNIQKFTARYELSRSEEKINYVMYMDDINLFAKNEK